MYALGFIVLLWAIPGEPYLVGQPAPLMGVECVPVAARPSLHPLPRVYLQDGNGNWQQQPDLRPYYAQVVYCSERLGIRTAVAADGPSVSDLNATPGLRP